MAQTTVQHANTIRFGSGLVEVGNDLATMINLGWSDDIKFGDSWDEVVLTGHNVGEVSAGIKNQKAFIGLTLREINFTNLQLIRGGIDTIETTTGSATPITNEAHVLTDTNAIRLTHKMGDNSEVGSIVVTLAAGTACVRDTDYVIGVDTAGFTTIARTGASSNITDSGGVLVDYSYTPNAAKKFYSGGKTTIGYRFVRITNVNAANKALTVTMFRSRVKGGISLDLKPDEDYEPAGVAIEFTGAIDSTRVVGKQLFEIVDEQAPDA